MPYQRYQNNRGGQMNPWANSGGVGGGGGGGLLPHPGAVDPTLALVGNLVGAMLGGQQGASLLGQPPQMGMMGMMGGGMGHQNRHYGGGRRSSPDRRSGGGRYGGSSSRRSRSPDRRRNISRRGGSPPHRKRSPPADRAEHEIYVGNYPATYGEADLKALFDSYDIRVGKIRMKSEGVKVFAFAETDSLEMITKAKAEMDEKEIEGRRLRVRGSKETEKKQRDIDKGSKRRRDNNKPRYRTPKVEDTKKHMVTAFLGFIDREMKAASAKEENQASQQLKDLLGAAKVALVAAYSLPEDKTYDVDRTMEDIFYRAVRNDVKIPLVEEAEGGEAKKKKEEDKATEAQENKGNEKEEDDTMEDENLEASFDNVDELLKEGDEEEEPDEANGQ